MKRDEKQKEVNHGTRYYSMAFRSSAQYSCFALVVRSPKISAEISLQTAVLYRRCGVFVGVAHESSAMSRFGRAR
jgi:hypothetical protein